MRSVAVVLACIAGLSACNTSAPDVRFDPAEAAFIKTPGKATIEGHAFLRDKHGQGSVRYAAGEIVRLVPATVYAQARFSSYYGGAKFVPALWIPKIEPDLEYVAYTRTTKPSRLDASCSTMWRRVAIS